jgi:hypothetical protein
MRGRSIRVIAFGAFLTASVSIARASGIATYIEAQANAPIQVLGCNAGLQYVNSGYGTEFYRLNMFAQFKNVSSKTAVAVMINFQLADAFGDVLDNLFGQSSGQFSPGIEIDGQKWSNTDTWPGLGSVRCSVSRALFADGSTWTENATSAAPSGIYHYKGDRWYGRTKHGAYACEKEAIAAGDRASLNGQ